MPKMTDRERLAKMEADQQRLADEADSVRRAVRASYATIAAELAIETLSEREFRELLAQAIRTGGPAAIAALKGVPLAPTAKPPERRPSDEHGGAARRRPAPPSGAAASGDRAGH